MRFFKPLNRTGIFTGGFAAIALTIGFALAPVADAEAKSKKRGMVSAEQIFQKLAAGQNNHQARNRTKRGRPVATHRQNGQRGMRRPGRMSLNQLKRNHQVRRSLPSINIQAINFEFGSARIPHSQRWKVEAIASAMLRFGGYERFLIEGHTDAVGSFGANLELSERRAQSLKYALIDWFGVPARSLVTVGYGEEYLLINTPWEEWANRRVTLRRVTDVLR